MVTVIQMSPSNVFLVALALLLLVAATSSASLAGIDKQQQQIGSSLGQLMMSRLSESSRSENKQPNAKELKPSPSSITAKKNKQLQQLKKKWHKLVDELIDNELPSSSSSSSSRASLTSAQMMVNEPIARRRQPVAAASQMQQQQPGMIDDDSEKIVLVVKRKPALDLNAAGSGAPISPALIAFNNLDLANGNGQQQQQPSRSPMNMLEHQRKILNDGFDIRRESIFTTNNHLGQKGVPKFGNDEQF